MTFRFSFPPADETAACVVIESYVADSLNDFQTGLKVAGRDGIASLAGGFLFHYFALSPVPTDGRRVSHHGLKITISRKITSVQCGRGHMIDAILSAPPILLVLAALAVFAVAVIAIRIAIKLAVRVGIVAAVVLAALYAVGKLELIPGI